jgi:hypothetical protein
MSRLLLLFHLHLLHIWAVLRGDYVHALDVMQRIVTVEFDALEKRIKAVTEKEHLAADRAAARDAEAQAKVAEVKTEIVSAAKRAANTKKA